MRSDGRKVLDLEKLKSLGIVGRMRQRALEKIETLKDMGELTETEVYPDPLDPITDRIEAALGKIAHGASVTEYVSRDGRLLASVSLEFELTLELEDADPRTLFKSLTAELQGIVAAIDRLRGSKSMQISQRVSAAANDAIAGAIFHQLRKAAVAAA